ncbi:MAG: hypothetical protein LC634_11780, partial [Sphingomonadales bacterium]|nr:hypothetical protein [Sphingomonadales bacterium]
GISSTVHSAKAWGLLTKRRSAAETESREATPRRQPPTVGDAPERMEPAADETDPITRVIEDALRAAGLMK